MNLLVTGGCGFIGSNFINYFIARYGNKLNKLVNIDAIYYCASESNIKPFVYESEPTRKSNYSYLMKVVED